MPVAALDAVQTDFFRDTSRRLSVIRSQTYSTKGMRCRRTYLLVPDTSADKSSTKRVGVTAGYKTQALSTMWMSKTRISVVARPEPAVIPRNA